MPNTPTIGEAAIVMSSGEMATKEVEKLLECIFGAIGKIWRVDKKFFDIVTALSGSGPTYIFLATEAMADGGVVAGLPRDLAMKLASQTVLGATAMAINLGKHPGQLKDDVASPAGTTIAGVRELENGGFHGTLMHAVITAANRSQELSERISSTESKDTDPSVLVNGHFDSPLGSPGAGDCASCVGGFNDINY
ncbi:pyrroline-5-carboxylate reductase-like isoform X2 [Magnolia sinica]|nr:pyrroline-5-carboxylate reductase-like isoform X2 [Magnolia sinica]